MIDHNISYGHQYISEEDIQAVVETLKSDYLTQGPKISEFEQNFAKYLGCQYACMVSNGTAALHLCAMALGIKPGDKVISDSRRPDPQTLRGIHPTMKARLYE